jgi:hypothetical protein
MLTLLFERLPADGLKCLKWDFLETNSAFIICLKPEKSMPNGVDLPLDFHRKQM